MIKAEFTKVNGHYMSYSLSGHAGYAEHGKDIVCASVSALYVAISNALTEIKNTSFMQEESQHCFIYHPNKKTDYLVGILFRNILEISEQYPDNVEVTLTDKSFGFLKTLEEIKE